MGISRRVEYVRTCDVADCYTSEAANWETREQAEAAALRDGWVKAGRGRWLCPKCKQEAEKLAAIVHL